MERLSRLPSGLGCNANFAGRGAGCARIA